MKKSQRFAEIEFSAVGGRYEKFVNQCNQEGIPLRDITPVAGGIQGHVSVRWYLKMTDIAKKCQTKLHVLQRSGVYFHFRGFRMRWGLALAPVIFLFSMLLFKNVVWSIRWQGVEIAQRPIVKQALYSMDIYEGAFLNQQKIQDCENKLLVKLPELGWLSLNFSKGRLVVEASEAKEKPKIEPNDLKDIVSAADGTVLRTDAEEGVLLKSVGQTVAKGDVLIRAGREDRDGRMIQTHAKGTVIARVKKKYKSVQLMNFEQNVPSQGIQSIRKLCFLNHKIALQDEVEEIPENAQIRCHPVQVLGFALPFTIEENFWLPHSTKQIKLTEQQAFDWAKEACLTQLYQEFPDAEIELEEHELEIGQNEVSCTLSVTFVANIARLELLKK